MSGFLSGMGSVLDLGGIEPVTEFFSRAYGPLMGSLTTSTPIYVSPGRIDVDIYLALSGDYQMLARDAERARIRLLQEDEEPARKAS
jgi:hypothetical protein